MVNLFFDSSGLTKRYTDEQGSEWVQLYTEPTFGQTIYISALTHVEVTSALTRKRRGRHLSDAGYDAAIALVNVHCRNEYVITAVSEAVIERAVKLTRNHALRAYDAVQLATALIVAQALAHEGLEPPTVVAADQDLLRAAQAEGLATVDPNSLS